MTVRTDSRVQVDPRAALPIVDPGPMVKRLRERPAACDFNINRHVRFHLTVNVGPTSVRARRPLAWKDASL